METDGGQTNSTKANYLRAWRNFNKFLIKLDKLPILWEDRVSLFLAYLIEGGAQSGTIKSYVSAIKSQLQKIKYEWNDSKLLLHSLVRVCKIRNDCVTSRLPIQCSLLENVLFEVARVTANQPYLTIMYQALFAVGYYGLLRTGELTSGEHTVKAANVQIAVNKEKILLLLYSSKTHGKESRPQKITLKSIKGPSKATGYVQRCFCPCNLLNKYMKVRGPYKSEKDNLFVFSDRVTEVSPQHASNILAKCLKNIGVEFSVYTLYSLRIGRATDMLRFGYTVEEIKREGRWKSNAVFKYLR